MSYEYPKLDIKLSPYQFSQDSYKKEINLEDKLEEEKIVIHQITPCDTLFGIALQYDVPVERLKSYNNLYSNEIYYLKELRIPNAKTMCFPPYNDEDIMQSTHRQLLLYFSTLVRPEDSRDEKLMSYYLKEASYDINEALKEYQQDLKFEEDQKKMGKQSYFSGHKYMELKKFN